VGTNFSGACTLNIYGALIGTISDNLDFDRKYLRNVSKYRQAENGFSTTIPAAFDEKNE